MKKEYELVSDFDKSVLSGVFYTIQTAIEQESHELLDLESCKAKVDEAFRAIACKKRFEHLNEISNTAIKYSRDCFLLDNHKFETLDEVERAWKLKAFI
jgi:hypothetical protein